MDLSIDKLAEMAGISTRTLRHYHAIGLLEPSSCDPSGRRRYGASEVLRLQKILFYKQQGVPLAQIGPLLDSDDSTVCCLLEKQLEYHRRHRKELDTVISSLEKTINDLKGGNPVEEKDLFAALKQDAVNQNREKYGAEADEKYGADTVAASEKKILDMDPNKWDKFHRLEAEILQHLEDAVMNGKCPDSEEGKVIASLHKEWICMTWPFYSAQAHKGLAAGYLADDRFRKYYDKNVEGCAEFLTEAVNRFVDEL